MKKKIFISLLISFLLKQQSHTKREADSIALVNSNSNSCMIKSINSKYSIENIILFNVSDAINNYDPPGCLDGLGARKLNDNTIQILCNHEIDENTGFEYILNDNKFKGARISYFDLNIENNNFKIIKAGLAYSEIVFVNNEIRNLKRFCSASYYNADEFGLKDDIYLAGEEIPDNGCAFALDVKEKILYEIEALGKHSFENIVLVDIGLEGYTCCLIGDDNYKQPLYLYIGKKEDGDFLSRNGLKNGTKYYWCSDNNNIGEGYFLPIKNTTKQPYLFSRPEDIACNPYQKNVAVFNATNGGNKQKGIIYIVTFDILKSVTDQIKCDISILHNCNVENNITNPDNVMWTNKGDIYIQEDNYNNSSIWKISGNKNFPISNQNKEIEEIITINDNHELFNKSWETSGIIDITYLLDTTYSKKNTEYFLTTVQTNNTLSKSSFNKYDYVKLGQLILIIKTNL